MVGQWWELALQQMHSCAEACVCWICVRVFMCVCVCLCVGLSGIFAQFQVRKYSHMVN